MRVTVIVCSIDDAKLERASASYRARLGDALREIVAIRDARSLAEAYNRGIDRARGDTLVFTHDDVEVLSPDFATRLDAHLAAFDVVGIAGTQRLCGGGWYFAGHPHDYMLVVSPHPETGKPTLVIEGGGALVVPGIQALDGVFLATRATTARALRFDEAAFDHFHLYDLDFTFRAHLAGARLAVCRDLVLLHASRGSYDARWDDYRERFERKFAGQLAPPPAEKRAPIVNVPLDEAILRDPTELARLCHPATLQRFVTRLDAAVPA
jgi:glycosyltransferase involved in cell wall biosynthesis